VPRRDGAATRRFAGLEGFGFAGLEGFGRSPAPVPVLYTCLAEKIPLP